MLDIDDIVAAARRWLADAQHSMPPHFGERGRVHYAPLLTEALRNGPLDNATLADALDECALTGDDAAQNLVAQLLTISEDDREIVCMQLAEGWQA